MLDMGFEPQIRRIVQQDDMPGNAVSRFFFLIFFFLFWYSLRSVGVCSRMTCLPIQSPSLAPSLSPYTHTHTHTNAGPANPALFRNLPPRGAAAGAGLPAS